MEVLSRSKEWLGWAFQREDLWEGKKETPQKTCSRDEILRDIIGSAQNTKLENSTNTIMLCGKIYFNSRLVN